MSLFSAGQPHGLSIVNPQQRILNINDVNNPLMYQNRLKQQHIPQPSNYHGPLTVGNDHSLSGGQINQQEFNGEKDVQKKYKQDKTNELQNKKVNKQLQQSKTKKQNNQKDLLDNRLSSRLTSLIQFVGLCSLSLGAEMKEYVSFLSQKYRNVIRSRDLCDDFPHPSTDDKKQRKRSFWPFKRHLDCIEAYAGPVDASMIYNIQQGHRPIAKTSKIRRTYVEEGGEKVLTPELVQWYSQRCVSLADGGFSGSFSRRELREGLLEHWQELCLFWQSAQ